MISDLILSFNKKKHFSLVSCGPIFMRSYYLMIFSSTCLLSVKKTLVLGKFKKIWFLMFYVNYITLSREIRDNIFAEMT